MTILDANKNRPKNGGASFTFRNRFQRSLWNLMWLLLASWTPRPLHRWRVFVLTCAGAKVHPSAHVYGSARIWSPSNLVMGRNSCIGPQVNCYNMAQVHIADYAIVSQGAHLCGGDHDIDDPDFQLIAKPILVGRHSWVAAEAFIGPGVSIGDFAVVGARSVLFRDAQTHGVYTGNPAKLIRSRGTNESA